MRTILMTAYAVDPYKGSEDGMGWHYIVAAAHHNNIIAVTRKNNRAHIEQYMSDGSEADKLIYERIQFLYFDWPKWMLGWKKGPMLSMIYYYFWQLTLAIWLKVKSVPCDMVHNLNFHNDWTPSFLWIVNKNFTWGPVGHHPKIPAAFIKQYGKKEYIKDRLLWGIKCSFWSLDPFLYLAKKSAKAIWCMHQQSADKLGLATKCFLHPSIAASDVVTDKKEKTDAFTILSVGRFVPLKGFDVAIRSFARFYHSLPVHKKQHIQLVLVGKGPYKDHLKQLAIQEQVQEAIKIIDWLPQEQLQEIYGNANVFLYPSHEGAGMVVAEAMRYGMPVVCWDNAGPGNIVHPASQLKVKYGGYNVSVTSFADKITHLFFDKQLYESEARLAAQRFKEALSWQVKPGQLQAFYKMAEAQHSVTLPAIRYTEASA